MKKQRASPPDNQYDLDDNFFKTSNDYKDALCKIRISGQAHQILDAIERMTWGWRKKWAEISYREFRQMTGMDNYHISRGIKHLLKMHIIIVARIGNKGELSYRIEMDYTQWRSLPKKATTKNVDAPLPKKATTIVAKLGNRSIAQKGNNQQAGIKYNERHSLKTEEEKPSLSLLKSTEKDLEEDIKKERFSGELQHKRIQLKDVQSQIQNHPDSIIQSNPSSQRKTR